MSELVLCLMISHLCLFAFSNRFTISWWAYTFPMTASAIATIHYSQKINNPFTQGLALLLSAISSIIVCSLSIFTVLHVFIWRTMFPNDMAIAISGETKIKRKIKALQEYHLPFCGKCGDKSMFTKE